MIDIIETVYRGASKGRGLVVSPKGMVVLTLWLSLLIHRRLLYKVPVLDGLGVFSWRVRYGLNSEGRNCVRRVDIVCFLFLL